MRWSLSLSPTTPFHPSLSIHPACKSKAHNPPYKIFFQFISEYVTNAEALQLLMYLKERILTLNAGKTFSILFCTSISDYRNFNMNINIWRYHLHPTPKKKNRERKKKKKKKKKAVQLCIWQNRQRRVVQKKQLIERREREISHEET